MITPNTLTYERWLDMYATAASSLTISYSSPRAGRSHGAARAHEYRLDLSSGSYAVEPHDWSTQLTPARWMDAIRSGARDTGSHQPAEWELIGAL